VSIRLKASNGASKPSVTSVGARPSAPPAMRLNEGSRAIQTRGARPHDCRTNACAPNTHARLTRPGQMNQLANQTRGVSQRTSASALNQRPPARAVSGSGPKSPNYNVHSPIPLGGGSQRIRATIQGTPQVAGSVELNSVGSGKVYISNLKVDQQHRRRGVAAKLIDAAVATARRQGFRAASLEARPSDNGISPQALVAMYRRQGFKSIGKSSRGSPLMERKL
jgi:ribosomal protein S18 acetylase RimI-like enzyme